MKYLRLLLILLFGIQITRLVAEGMYLPTFSAIEIYLLLVLFAALFIFSFGFEKKSHLKRRIFSFLNLLFILFFIGLNYFLVERNTERENKLDVIVIRNNLAFGHSKLSLKDDGSYIFYQNTGKMEGKYLYGTYKIEKNKFILNGDKVNMFETDTFSIIDNKVYVSLPNGKLSIRKGLYIN